MPTRITFASREEGRFTILVAESPDDVYTACQRAKGQPLALHDASSRDALYVNPAAMVFWQEAVPPRADFT